MPLVACVVDAVCCLLTAVELGCCVDGTGAALVDSKVGHVEERSDRCGQECAVHWHCPSDGGVSKSDHPIPIIKPLWDAARQSG
jgi:hypothetical protein